MGGVGGEERMWGLLRRDGSWLLLGNNNEDRKWLSRLQVRVSATHIPGGADLDELDE